MDTAKPCGYRIKAKTPLLAVRTTDPLDRDHTHQVCPAEALRFPPGSKLDAPTMVALLKVAPFFKPFTEGPFVGFRVGAFAYLVPDDAVVRVW